MTKIQQLFAATVLFLGMNCANAALITLTGTVNSADAGNIFGLEGGNTITATGEIDDSLLAGGIYGSITNLQIFVGSQTFDNSMDGGSPVIRLDTSGTIFDGSQFDFAYEANQDALGSLADFDSFFNSFTGQNTSTTKVKGSYPVYNIAGKWTEIEVAVVPVPAAAWLFGTGLLGLVGVARRKA